MKKTIYIFLLSVIFNYTYSQIAYMHYVTVKNSDVKEHIEAEKNVHSKLHKEEIDKGNKLAWDMWMISNSTYGEPTTTFLYVHFNNPDANYDTQNSSNFTAHEREAHRKAYQSRVVKEGGLTLGIKASYGIKPGDMPPKNLVINYMNVDFLKNYEYEQMEKNAGKSYKQNGRAAWGFGKILNHFGSSKNVQYLTFDFYNSMDEIMDARMTTNKLSKAQMSTFKAYEELRTIYNTHILTLVAAER